MAIRKQAVVVDIPLELGTASESRSFFPKIPTRSNLGLRKSVELDRPDMPNSNATLNCDMATLTLFDENHERVSFSFLSQRRDLPELHKLLQNAKHSYLTGRRRRLQEPELTIRGACIPSMHMFDESSESTDFTTPRKDDNDLSGNFQLPIVVPQKNVKAEPKRRADRRQAHRLGVPRFIDEQRYLATRKLPRIRPDSMNVTGNGFQRWDSLPALGDKAKTNLLLNTKPNVVVTPPTSAVHKPTVKFQHDLVATSKQTNDFIKISQPLHSSPSKLVPNDDSPFSIRNNTPVSTIYANETHRNAAFDTE